ncbi:MAG: hypothetical protein R3D29_10095 [Nitratireductor sp.]
MPRTSVLLSRFLVLATLTDFPPGRARGVLRPLAPAAEVPGVWPLLALAVRVRDASPPVADALPVP